MGNGRSLYQSQLARTRHRFRAVLHLKFAKYSAVVAFNGIDSQEKLLANFTIRESLSNELQDFDFPFAQRLR